MPDANDKRRPASRPIPAGLNVMLRASDGILDLLPIATFICYASGTILQYNQHAVQIWGRAPQVGQTHEQLTEGCSYFEVDGSPLPRSMLAEVLADGQPLRDKELLVRRHDGSHLFVSLNIDPLRGANGELVGAVNCFLDITERKRMDYALEHSRLRALEQEQLLAATYEHAAIGIAEVAPNGQFLRVNESMCAISGYSREHMLANKIFVH